MNKTLLLATIATTIFAFNANAMDVNPYISGKLRYSMMEPSVDFDGGDKFDVDDKVMGGSIALGLSSKINSGAIRAELEYNKNADAEKSYDMAIEGVNVGEGVLKMKTQSLFLNGYFDINTNTKFTPYISAGVGYTKMKGELKVAGLKGDTDDNTFSWQMGAGIGYALNDNVSAEIGYRYVDYGDFTDDGDKLEATAHEVLVGVRYNF